MALAGHPAGATADVDNKLAMASGSDITKQVYASCWDEIQDWIDVGAMQGQLMKYNIIQNQNDMFHINHGPPGERRNYVYTKACKMRNGFPLLYKCLRESQDSHMGHKDAADVLEERARAIAATAIYAPPLHQDSGMPSLDSDVECDRTFAPTSSIPSNTSTFTSCASSLAPGMLSTPVEEHTGRPGETSPQAQSSISDLLARGDFKTLYHYSLNTTSYDLQFSSLSEEGPLIDYLVRFTVAIFNSRDRSSSALPGMLIAGVQFSVCPSTTVPGETVTKAMVVRVTVEENKFEENLREELRRVRCHGSDRPLSDRELECVRVEFAAADNHGNNLFCVYVCPSWEVCEDRLYYCLQSERYGEREEVRGMEYWCQGDRGCGLLLYDRVQARAEQLLSSWQQYHLQN